MSILFRWLLVTFAFLLVSRFVPGIEVASFYTALILAIFWGIANAILKPILIVLTLPVNILTLGLFTFVINGFLFWLLSTFIKGFYVEGFLAAILGALIISIISWAGNQFIGKK